jgi:low temperature requirement protein LtrA
MTAQVKSVRRLHLQVVVAMANLAASLGTNPALAVMASQVVMVLHRVVHVWAMQRSVHNAMRWNPPKTPCVVWLPKRTGKC